MKKFFFFSLLCLFVVYSFNIFAQKQLPQTKTIKRDVQKVNANPSQSLINIGNVTSWVRDDGFHDWVVGSMHNGSFPNGVTTGTIFSEGIVWGGQVYDGSSPITRVNGNTYGTGCVPKTRLYRVRPDFLTGDLTTDAATFYNIPVSLVTANEIQTVKDQYQTDWNEWPAYEGAPFRDVNGNGVYDSEDIPGVPGASQTLFVNYLDDSTASASLYGSPVIGLEITETYWAYAGTDIIYKKVDLVYKGTPNSVPTSHIDSMYITQWADPDVGNSSDDFAGCDTTLNLGYAYNAGSTDQEYSSYSLKPPAVGYSFLQGASNYTGNPSDSARFNLKWRKGYKYFNRKQMSSFVYFSTGGYWHDPDFNYGGTLQFYNLMRGKLPIPQYPAGDPFPDILADVTTDGTYLLAGDPVTGTGKIDGVFEQPGDGRILVVNGPFSMSLGDTVEVVIAEINAMPKNFADPNPNLSSITKLRENTVLAQSIADGKVGAFLSGPDIIDINNEANFSMSFLPPGVQVNSSNWLITNKPGGSNAQLTNIQTNSATLKADIVGDYEIANISNVGGKTFTNFKTVKVVLGIIPGEGFYVAHIDGISDASIDVTLVDTSKQTGHNYEVFFTQHYEVRNSNGDWVPASVEKLKKPGDLTGTTISIGAGWTTDPNQVELNFSLDLQSPTAAWADGISVTLPSGVTIIDAPTFDAGGGTITPEIVGQTINFGDVTQSNTQNGIFHGGETWSVLVSTFSPPINIDYTVYDDTYGNDGGPVNASGTVTISSIGLTRLAKYWNVKDLTTGIVKLENQGIINDNNLFPPRDDLSPDLINNIPYYLLPVVDGFRVRVSGSYDAPKTFSSKNPPSVNGLLMSPSGFQYFSTNFILTNFTIFGLADGLVSTTLPNYASGSGGTADLNQLQQDVELRWTGVLGDTVINGQTIKITKSGGSYVTLFGASGGRSLANHPLNPNPGSTDPFAIRVPFEIWNIDTNEKINALWWDRTPIFDASTNAAVWNTNAREYLWIVNTPQSNSVIDPLSVTVQEHGTWNEVLYRSTFNQGDVLRINYDNPIIISVDKFDFNTIATPVSENAEVINSFRLEQNFPNPFNPITTIRYVISQAGIVSLKIYDVLGQEVKTLINEYKNAGVYSINFDAERFASGVYFYQLRSGSFVETKKMILQK